MSSTGEPELLLVFEHIPDLLGLAREQPDSPEGIYTKQDALREKYRLLKQPLRWSMPYRHLDTCPECNYQATAVQIIIEQSVDDGSPPLQAVVWEIDLHKIRFHGASFTPECRHLLECIKNREQ